MKKTPAILAVAILGLSASTAASQQPPLDETARAIHLLQRATFGARPEDVGQLLQLGRDQWLDRQLHPGRINDAAMVARLQSFPSLAISMTDQLVAYQRAQAERRQMPQAEMDKLSQAERATMQDSMRRAEQRNLTPEQRRQRQMQNPQNLMVELVGAKLTRAVYSERQLEEVMTDFWFNHFNVFFGKNLDRFMIHDYEEQAIRTHVFGKFRDLLEATAKHPAMLFYLDNATSVVPDSMNPRAARQRPNRQRGLNENYARELMELHTLGVDGGYTQTDVIEVARALTGWSFERPAARNARGPGEVAFVFRPLVHDRGEKLVLGKKLPAGRGIEDGEEVLDILARHPSTARFIAGKLVERFVADEAPAELVAEIANVFQKTDGDLREITRALFSSPHFYQASVQRAKVKTPFELVASALRVTRADVGVSRATVMTLRSLGHLPYNEPAPTGYPAASEDWVNTGAMVNRMNFGLALAAGRLDGVKLDASRLLGTAPPAAAGELVPLLLARLLPGVNTANLQNTILTELARPATDLPAAEPQPDRNEMRARPRQNARNEPVSAPVREKGARALGLALGSPEFQRK